MHYKNTIMGILIKRVNRFIAEVDIDGKKELAHIKNTGRLKEILIPDNIVSLEINDNPKRKTKYSLIAVLIDNEWINIDSLVPNKVSFEAIKTGKIIEIGPLIKLKSEVSFGDSRFDLYYETEDEKGFIEVKGVTYHENGIAKFPDAITSRGTKHVYELIKALDYGYKSTILFIIQFNGCVSFTANKAIDPIFSKALLEAKKKGVRIIAYDTTVSSNEINLGNKIEVNLND